MSAAFLILSIHRDYISTQNHCWCNITLLIFNSGWGSRLENSENGGFPATSVSPTRNPCEKGTFQQEKLEKFSWKSFSFLFSSSRAFSRRTAKALESFWRDRSNFFSVFGVLGLALLLGKASAALKLGKNTHCQQRRYQKVEFSAFSLETFPNLSFLTVGS